MSAQYHPEQTVEKALGIRLEWYLDSESERRLLHNATALALPPELKGLDSAPALYGDVIYPLSRSGRVVAPRR